MTNENRKHLAEAVIYISLLVFFTYTAVFVEGLKDLDSCWVAYKGNQATPFALLTNFGLLLLIVIDYISGKSRVEANVVLCVCVVFALDIIIYGHAKVMANPVVYRDYECLLNIPCLFALFHWATIGYLVYLKYQTLKEYSVTSL
ncbi:MAG: hypothetical protein J6C05_05965 [Prevotella sp.]|nr:hypothetical protein [Prevotella sp.]